VITPIAAGRPPFDPIRDFDPIAILVTTGLVHVTGQVIELNRSGKLRILAVASPSRLGAAPDIPTAIEQGPPGMIAQNFIGVFAPARTPPAIVEQVAKATHAVMADELFLRSLTASGFEPYPASTPETARRLVVDETARWAPVIKAIGLKLD
jgi:tripartite-type tricarboxylate transporter receptor subunit TctC